MRGFAIGLLVVAGALGCHPSQASDTDGVCTILCRCADPTLPGDQRACEVTCEAHQPVTDTCAECVYEHELSCSTLIATCNAICQPVPVNGGGGGTDGGVP